MDAVLQRTRTVLATIPEPYSRELRPLSSYSCRPRPPSMSAPPAEDYSSLANPASLAALCRQRWLTHLEVHWILSNCHNYSTLTSIVRTTELEVAPVTGDFVLYDLTEDLQRPRAEFSSAKRKKGKMKLFKRSKHVLYKRDGVRWMARESGGLKCEQINIEIGGARRLVRFLYNSADGALRKKVYNLVNSTVNTFYYFVQYLSCDKFRKKGKMHIEMESKYLHNSLCGAVDDDNLLSHLKRSHLCFADEVMEAAKKVRSDALDASGQGVGDIFENGTSEESTEEYTRKQLVQYFGLNADIRREVINSEDGIDKCSDSTSSITYGDGELCLSRRSEQALHHASLLADSLQAYLRRTGHQEATHAGPDERATARETRAKGFGSLLSPAAVLNCEPQRGEKRAVGPATTLVRYVQLKMSLLLRERSELVRRAMWGQFDASATVAIAAILEAAL